MNKIEKNVIKINRKRVFKQKLVGLWLLDLFGLRKLRVRTWRKMFDIGEGLNIADNVLAKRRHYFSAGKLIDGETGLLTIGKDCAISPGTQIDYTGKVTIGNNAEISGNVLILSHQHPSNPKLRRKITIPLIVEIGDNAWLGERCVLVPSKKTGGLKIGENAIVAAGAVVTKDVPDNMIVGGNPAVIISQQERS